MFDKQKYIAKISIERQLSENRRKRRYTVVELSIEVAKIIEKKVGLSIDEIREMSPTDFSNFIKQKKHKKLSFSSEFPFIGRGNVLRKGIISSDEINKEVDKLINL